MQFKTLWHTICYSKTYLLFVFPCSFCFSDLQMFRRVGRYSIILVCLLLRLKGVLLEKAVFIISNLFWDFSWMLWKKNHIVSYLISRLMRKIIQKLLSFVMCTHPLYISVGPMFFCYLGGGSCCSQELCFRGHLGLHWELRKLCFKGKIHPQKNCTGDFWNFRSPNILW